MGNPKIRERKKIHLKKANTKEGGVRKKMNADHTIDAHSILQQQQHLHHEEAHNPFISMLKSGINQLTNSLVQDTPEQKAIPVPNPSTYPVHHDPTVFVQQQISNPTQALLFFIAAMVVLFTLRKLASYLFRRKKVRVIKKYD